jgi:3-hydroxyacyl-[acyl-carrier-protein] dehydratase
MRYLLVDRIDAVEPNKRASGWKNAAMSEDVFEWHFPDRPIVPGTIVLESLAQLAGWLEAVSSGFERWVLLDRVASAKVIGFAVPGDRIELRLEQVPHADPARRSYRGESLVGGERRALVEFEAVVVPLESLDAKDRAKRAYEALAGASPAPAPRKGPA